MTTIPHCETDPLLLTSDDSFPNESCLNDLDSKINEIPEIPAEKDEKKIIRAQKKMAKKNRETGKQYWGYSRQGSKIKQDVIRAERKQSPTCTSKYCIRSSLRHCSLFSKDERSIVFERFWKMNWSQKKAYVCNLVKIDVKKTNTAVKSRRSHTPTYFLMKANGREYQVCRNMFLSTLGIKEKMMRYWVNSKLDFGMFEHPDDIQEKKMIKFREGLYYKKNQERKNHLRQFLTMLPKLESHYCRKDSKKKYFQTEHRTLTALYKDYVHFCHQHNVKKLSISVFIAMVKELNYSLFKPRKDQCDTCCAYKTGNITDEEFVAHRSEIDESSKEKLKDINDALKKLCTLLCMDVEAVQLVPKLLASCLYFSLKLQIHNFTIYDIISHKSVNYVWDESEGELEASIFASIIVLHIENLIEKNLIFCNTVILYSDGCCYQNRNAVLSSALSNLAVKHSLTIYQKYLVKGHTHMECDSSHSLIERETKKKTINVPEDFIDAVSTARSRPFPLDVVKLTHHFFHNYAAPDLISYKSIRPGKNYFSMFGVSGILNSLLFTLGVSKGDPTVTDLRCLKYTKDGKISFKLSHKDEYKILPQKKQLIRKYEPTKLYDGPLELSFRKFDDLQKLKNVLPAENHTFYDKLRHKAKPKKTKI